MLFDTHAHYDDEKFDADRDAVLSGLADRGVSLVLNPGCDPASSRKAVELAQRYPFLYAAVGWHPENCGPYTGLEEIRALAKNPKVKAIGEIGLDYYWEEPEHHVQKKWFVRQLALARELKLPVIIHSRDAARDTLDIMKAEHAEDMGGVIHCFSYGKELAREYLNMGFYLGIGGVVTFRNAKKLKEVAEYAPLERIVLETDCPYLAPVPNRGKRNSSLNLPYVLEMISQLKNVSREDVERVTWENGMKLYGLSQSG